METEASPAQKQPSLKEEAYERLKDFILSDAIGSGQVLDVGGLASQLAVSRTPLREALLMLEQDGLVETIPYKGTYVAKVTSKDVEDIFQVREALEPLAASLATRVIPEDELEEMQASLAIVGDQIASGNFREYSRSDIALHELIIRYCGNDVLEEVLHTLADRISRVRAYSMSAANDPMLHSHHEHCLVLDAIREGDGASAARLMAEHIRKAGKRIAELVPDERGA